MMEPRGSPYQSLAGDIETLGLIIVLLADLCVFTLSRNSDSVRLF